MLPTRYLRMAFAMDRAWVRAAALVLACFALAPTSARANERIKDLVNVRGVRSNPLVGYGLVIGLAGTGDTRRSTATQQALAQFLREMGNSPTSLGDLSNTASVMITAELPAFASPGDRIDVDVSAIANARSLAGGTLLLTRLIGVDGKLYAMAQGRITVGGFQVEGGGLGRSARNTPTSGRIPSGADVERSVPSRFVHEGKIHLSLIRADFTTATRIADAINQEVGAGSARAINSGGVVVDLPTTATASATGAAAEMAIVPFLARIEALTVTSDGLAKITLSERTGTVVMGGEVRLKAASIANANFNVEITNRPVVSQPGPFSAGQTVVVPDGERRVWEDRQKIHAVADTTTVKQLVDALNALGASPRDLISILQALQKNGALVGRLEVI